MSALGRFMHVAGIAATTAIAFGRAAPAQQVPSAEEGGGLEEIIVTAEKREESLQDTPISIAALTSTDIEMKGISEIADLRSEVPGLQVTPHPNSATTARVFIRGVGNNDDQITQDPSVAVYQDGVYVARSQGLSAEVAQIERIEVLRGPQGSLYGRNATGGAINYVTRAPELGAFGFTQSLMVGNRDQFRARTRVNLPVGERLALELGYVHAQENGYVDNLGTGERRWGDERRDAYRAALRWQPTDAFEIRYAYDRSEIGDTPVFIARVPFYPATADRPSAGSPLVQNLRANDVTAQGHNLTASWELAESLTLRSITAYRELDNDIFQNYHTGVAGPFALIVNQTDSGQRQLSEELQLLGEALDARLEYVLGAYYFDESADSFDTSRITGVRSLDRTVTIDNTAYALYGQATYRPGVLEKLYLTGGLRWSRDERQATLEQINTPAGRLPVVVPPGRGDRDFSNVSPTLVVGYDVSEDVNVYAKYSRGYKTGGYNVRASSIPKFNEGFDEESLDSFELGLKSTWFDNRLRLNLAAFLSDYDDIQTNVQVDPTIPGLTDVLNAGKAEIEGIELDVTAQPLDDLTIGVSYAWLDAGFEEILDPAGNDLTSRYTFIQAPEHTVAANLDYRFGRTPLGALTAHIEYFYQARKFTTTNSSLYVLGDYGLLDARLTLSEVPFGPGSWRLSAYGKNLTDEEYYADHFNSILPSAIFGEPRSYGLELIFEY